MPQREIVFILSQETDAEFQGALARLQSDFPGWSVCGISRREEVRNGKSVPLGVITVQT
jgi:hypothetical protein